ncbi:hypothetical protein PHMEG_00021124 [Phytophthora megakarya]|uniref:Peptidase A2 domain-containing protein n=1 Tax=Phytophthora megakarya TaxID=4795 RepID=A0A225VNK4_9STRA|nr:hypothetical protein PHMEG_00021124 [Phytophthora megakarya]
MGAIDNTRTRILLDTGANVSVISAAYANLGLEVRGINPGVLETRGRTLVKITLGWERVYEFEMWIMEHSAGIDVVLGTDFIIPARVRLDLFHDTARLPDEVTVPLVKSAGAADDEPYGAQVIGGPTEDLYIPRGEWREFRLPPTRPSRATHENQTNGTDGDGVPQRQACVGPSDERVGRDSSVLHALLCGTMDTQGRAPKRSGVCQTRLE